MVSSRVAIRLVVSWHRYTQGVVSQGISGYYPKDWHLHNMFMLKHEPSPLALGSHHRLICIMKHEGGSLANVNITILDTDMYKEKASIWTARFNLGNSCLSWRSSNWRSTYNNHQTASAEMDWFSVRLSPLKLSANLPHNQCFSMTRTTSLHLGLWQKIWNWAHV